MNLHLLGISVLTLISLSHGAEEEKCGEIADVAFVLDSSRSIWYKDFDKEKSFVETLVAKFDVKPDKAHVAALQFAKDVKVEFNFNEGQDAGIVKEKVSAIKQSNGKSTFTHLALRALRTELFNPSNGARPNVPKICILLSDGESTQTQMTKEEAKRVKEANITLLAIGVGSSINKYELETMVTPPASENFFHVGNFDELKDHQFQKLVGKQACDQKDKPDETCQGKEADVVFVLDQSSSIWPVDFKEQLAFVNATVDAFDISSGKTQVGAAVFSDNADVVFDLDEYDNKGDIGEAVLGIDQVGGLTNTHLALQLVLNRMFTKKSGYRSWAAHICILITDGISRKQTLTAEMAEKAHAQGIYMFAIGVGNKTDADELAAIASEPASDFMFMVNGYKALPHIKDILAYKTCTVS